jgi:hypothetical protein
MKQPLKNSKNMLGCLLCTKGSDVCVVVVAIIVNIVYINIFTICKYGLVTKLAPN